MNKLGLSRGTAVMIALVLIITIGFGAAMALGSTPTQQIGAPPSAQQPSSGASLAIAVVMPIIMIVLLILVIAQRSEIHFPKLKW